MGFISVFLSAKWVESTLPFDLSCKEAFSVQNLLRNRRKSQTGEDKNISFVPNKSQVGQLDKSLWSKGHPLPLSQVQKCEGNTTV